MKKKNYFFAASSALIFVRFQFSFYLSTLIPSSSTKQKPLQVHFIVNHPHKAHQMKYRSKRNGNTFLYVVIGLRWKAPKQSLQVAYDHALAWISCSWASDGCIVWMQELNFVIIWITSLWADMNLNLNTSRHWKKNRRATR